MTSVLKQRELPESHKSLVDKPSLFKVTGYNSTFNMWEKLSNLGTKHLKNSKTSSLNAPFKVPDNPSSYKGTDYMIHLVNATKLRIVKASLVDQININKTLFTTEAFEPGTPEKLVKLQ